MSHFAIQKKIDKKMQKKWQRKKGKQKKHCCKLKNRISSKWVTFFLFQDDETISKISIKSINSFGKSGTEKKYTKKNGCKIWGREGGEEKSKKKQN